MQQRKVQQIRETALARHEAREIQRIHPAIFQRLPVPVSDLAEVLGLKVERRPELRQRARLELVEHSGAGPSTILVQANLDQNVSRFAVAHEIGHAVLLWKHPDIAREWEVGRREAFANVFATELLASPEVRTEMARTFRSLSDPLGLLRLASQIGLSPHAILRLAMFERSWIAGLNKIWLRVKYRENVFTHEDPKLRIVSAHYDPDRFFVATNQSLFRFAGDENWLTSLVPGCVAHHRTMINISFKGSPTAAPKFVPKEVLATLSGVRLRPSSSDMAAYLIILVDLAPVSSET